MDLISQVLYKPLSIGWTWYLQCYIHHSLTYELDLLNPICTTLYRIIFISPMLCAPHSMGWTWSPYYYVLCSIRDGFDLPCNIPHSKIKTTISYQPKNRVIIYIYIYIHGFRIKIYQNFNRVPPIPEGPKLSTCNLFTLLITRIS